jgi:hypothetical protein
MASPSLQRSVTAVVRPIPADCNRPCAAPVLLDRVIGDICVRVTKG